MAEDSPSAASIWLKRAASNSSSESRASHRVSAAGAVVQDDAHIDVVELVPDVDAVNDVALEASLPTLAGDVPRIMLPVEISQLCSSDSADKEAGALLEDPAIE